MVDIGALCCVRRTKIKNLKAIHNPTDESDVFWKLCSKNKDKKSESNSQHLSYSIKSYLCCVRRTKIKNLKAIHNDYNSTCPDAFRAQKGFLWYATRFQKPSVLKTGFWGTEGIFGTRNPLLRYGTSHVYRERPPDAPNETEESGFGSEIGDFAKNGHLYAPVTAAKQLHTAVGCHQTTANRHKIATKPLQTAANRHRLSWTASNCR